MIDRRLKTIQAYPLSVTPLALFLARDIRLDRGVVVTQVTRRAGGFSILARDGRKHAEGRIALDFTDAPLALAGWTITDRQGGATRVRLLDFAPAGPFPASLFVLTDPKRWIPDPPSWGRRLAPYCRPCACASLPGTSTPCACAPSRSPDSWPSRRPTCSACRRSSARRPSSLSRPSSRRACRT